jgi:hypothetical protein
VVVLAILEEALLLFVVAELLHSITIALEHDSALGPPPFLVMGVSILAWRRAQGVHEWSPERRPSVRRRRRVIDRA